MRTLALLTLWLLAALAALAAEPPSDPVLRLETGMHTANINHIGVDAQENFLLTASEDKTLRLWDLSNGQLLHIYRPPIGSGHEGELYAAAIAPDASWVAAGGWTGYEWNGYASVYVFDRVQGHLLYRLGSLEDDVLDLCVSPDGKYLAATLWGGWGVRVWDTHTWFEVFRDSNYDGDSYGCAFDSNNRLATTSWDGYITLYVPEGESFNLNTYKSVPGGSKPYGIAFSPNGSKIAVGFSDRPAVNVLDANTLAWLYTADTGDLDNGVLLSVAWSQDGNGLYAAGSYRDNTGNNPVLYWPQAGQGTPVASSGSLIAIMDIHALSGGKLVYGTADPSFAVLAADGGKLLKNPAVTADFWDGWEGFLMSRDGNTVQFGFARNGQRPARFSLPDRTLIHNPSPDPALMPPDTESLNITDWRFDYTANSSTPRLNGVPLSLGTGEFSVSLAISPSHAYFLLGTTESLYFYTRNGQRLLKINVPGAASMVNISGDGTQGLAALGDGTIRWYNLRDGKELLAFFPHENGTDWVAWTPSGYYMSSSGEADKLIGWHVNNGSYEAANFSPAGALYATRKRPLVVQKILSTLSETEAVRLADLEETVEATPVSTALAENAPRYQVNLNPSGLGKAVIVAASGEQDSNTLFPFSNRAATDMYRLLWRRGFSDGDILYLNPYPPVVPADGYVDAARQDFALRQDPYADLAAAITAAAAELQAGRQFILYLHGHARNEFIRIGQTQELSSAELKLLLQKIPPGVKQILILDTCYSGSFLNDLAAPGRIVITSSDPESLAVSHQYGSFSEYFKDVLWHGFPLDEAFKVAHTKIRAKPEWFGTQEPWLDDDGDGIYDPAKDGGVAAQTYLGDQRYFGDLPPEIVELHPPLTLAASQTSATVWLRTVPSPDAIRQVRATFINEHDGVLQYQGENTQFTRREFYLQPNPDTGRFEFSYEQFHTARNWTILYQAQNREGAWSDIAEGRVTVAAAPVAVSLSTNQTAYSTGQRLTLGLSESNGGAYDLYAAVLFPDGHFYTFPRLNQVSALDTPLAWQGPRGSAAVLDLPLPVLPAGQYCFYGILSPQGEDVLAAMGRWVMGQRCVTIQ